ncbi:response regulator (plasmid) [Kovacikia minuta CCNUW1]|uniref:response regulator n=1 Tax=Kovacikia minuta TaxID=2931930 RepID=UPI001CCB8FBF|nr:response regulator [Kovacikia minuta]UBF30371.1 response regulator [Kovacikia minuta CCNUW1]
MRILLVEDDQYFSELIREALREHRYIVDTAADGETGWELAESLNYDLVLLDLTLPKLDGIRFCRQLRDRGLQVPVMLLTNRNSSQDKAIGLDAGADDYVLKTVEWQELEARIRALLRRKTVTVSTTLEWGQLRLDPASCEVNYGSQPLNLTAKEFALLELFLRNKERVYTNSAIVSQLWSVADEPPSEDTVRSHVRRLRQKLKAVGAADLVETVYGLGYRLNQAFRGEAEAESIPASLSSPKTPQMRLPAQPKAASISTGVNPVNQLLQPTRLADAKVMVVDDDPFMLRLLKGILEPWGLQVATLNDPLKFWDELDVIAPDLLVLDIQMPEVNGIELCQTLRNDTRWAWLPVLFLAGQQDANTIQQVFTAGADDYISKPVVAPEMITRIFNRLERTRLLRNQTENDPLTHLPNRYRAGQDVNLLLQQAERSRQPLCLAVLTIDNLKQINRQHEHRVGDTLLRQTAHLLRQELRSEDVISRWDGAEFLLALAEMTRQDGVKWLTRVLASLRQIEFCTTDGTLIRTTFSAGVSQYPDDGTQLQSLYQQAVAAMEFAENEGGDRVLPVRPLRIP